jgi:hypothetical protein
LADQNYILALSGIVFVKFTTSEERDSPRPKISRRDVVTRSARTLFDRQDFPIGTRIESPIASIQWNVPADGCALETWHIAQCAKGLFAETLTRWGVRILCTWQCDGTDPEILRAKANILLAQPNETGDEQCRACEQSD